MLLGYGGLAVSSGMQKRANPWLSFILYKLTLTFVYTLIKSIAQLF